jgi:hypothetical protein
MNFNNVLKNKYLYYVAVALMVINVLGYVSLGSIECILVLGGAAYLANQFTHNRTVDIFIGLFVSNILFGCGRLKEGFEGLANKADKLGIAASQKKKEEDEKSKSCKNKDAQGNCKKKANAAEHVANAVNAVVPAATVADGN